jgi:hypothetical protein
MSPSALRRASRGLYARARRLRAAREEQRFRTRMRADPAAAELVLSPHWDDAVLDCWSVLASAADVTVVNVFAGVPAPGGVAAWDRITGAADSAQRTRERIAEDAAALARAGRTAHNLPFLDAQYRPGASPPSLPELDAAVAATADTASRVYVPAGIGGHGDHVLVRRYGRMLARAGMPVTLYAELPYCVAHGWPHWVDGRPAHANRDVDVFWRSFLDSVPELGSLARARVVRLDDWAAAAKLKAMLCYATQIPALDFGARGMLTDPEILRYEVRWELLGGG